MTVAQLIEAAGYEDVVIFENPSFETAFVGVSHDNRAIYDYDYMVEDLMLNDGMSMEDAIEFIDFNTLRSLPYVHNSPIILFGLTALKEELNADS